MDNTVLVNLATAAMTVTAAALTVVAFQAFRVRSSQRVLLIAGGFFLFFTKGAVLSIGLFVTPHWGDALLPMSVVLDLGILALFYLAVLKRDSD